MLLVGCGAMSRRWLQYLTARADLEVVGLVDVAPQAAAARAGEVGLEVPDFTAVERAIAETAPAVVCDVTVPEAHASVAAAALQAGCHVLSEKPLAALMEEARATTALARSRGLTCAVMQEPPLQRADPRRAGHRRGAGTGQPGNPQRRLLRRTALRRFPRADAEPAGAGQGPAVRPLPHVHHFRMWS